MSSPTITSFITKRTEGTNVVWFQPALINSICGCARAQNALIGAPVDVEAGGARFGFTRSRGGGPGCRRCPTYCGLPSSTVARAKNRATSNGKSWFPVFLQKTGNQPALASLLPAAPPLLALLQRAATSSSAAAAKLPRCLSALGGRRRGPELQRARRAWRE